MATENDIKTLSANTSPADTDLLEWFRDDGTTLSTVQKMTYTTLKSSIKTFLGISEDDYTAKGDILVGTGTSAFTTLAVGTDEQILQANSIIASGVEWVDYSFLGMTDTPGSFVANKFASVNAGGTAIEFKDSAEIGTIIFTGVATGLDYAFESDGGTDLQYTNSGSVTKTLAFVEDVFNQAVAGEIAGLSEKVTPVNADLVVIEDSADSNNKKKVQVGNLPGGGGSSPLTTKGDVYTFSTVDARLPVGTDTYVLSADSSEATGLKWVSNAGAGTFLGLTDTPANFTGGGDKLVLVNGAESALIYNTSTTNGIDSLLFTTGVAIATADTGIRPDSVNQIVKWGWTGAAGETDLVQTQVTPANLGDILASPGTASGAMIVLPAGTNGQVLTAQSGQPSGLQWATAAGSSPLTTKGDLFGFSTVDVRVPVGADNSILVADSTGPNGVTYTPGFLQGVAGEINGLSLVTAASGDMVVIEDATDSFNKKKVNVSDFLGGGSTFLSLTDTPANYTGGGDKLVMVNTGETALIYNTSTTNGIDQLLMKAGSAIATADTGLRPDGVNQIVKWGWTGAAGETDLVQTQVTPSTLGDIIASPGGASGAMIVLSAGTNGQVLTAASGQPSGLQWATPATGATAFLGLSDTPANFTGGGDKLVLVNSAETALIYNTGIANGIDSLLFTTGVAIATADTGLRPDSASQKVKWGWAGAAGETDLVQTQVTPATLGDILASPGTASGAMIVLGAGTNGQVLTAASGQPSGLQWTTVNGSPVTQAYKTSDEAVISSTTLQNDDDLVLAVEANSTYIYEMALFVIQGGGSGSLKISMALPSGATIQHAMICNSTTETAQEMIYTTNISLSALLSGNIYNLGGGSAGMIKGIITTSGTSGNAQFQWAQGASQGAPGTLLKAGSYMTLRKIA